MNALDKAISILGGTAALARAIGVESNVVSNWRKRGVPVEVCPLIERATDRKVLCEELNDAVDWQYIRDSAQNIAESEFEANGKLHNIAASDDGQPPVGTPDRKPQRKAGGRRIKKIKEAK